MTPIEEPNPSLLRREDARALAEQHFSLALAALRDMVGYGTNLIIRAYNASDKTNVPMVVIGVLLKHIVGMLDAVDILMSEGHSYPALLQVRAAFEASINIDWILKEDSETRARCYIVSNLRDEALWAKRGIPGTPERSDFEAAVGSFLPKVDQERLEADARTHLVQVNGILLRPEFQPIDAKFTACKRKRPYEPDWYEVLGVKSIRQMAASVGRLRDYEVIYGRGSDAMHAGLYKDQVHFRPGGFTMRPLRSLGDAHNVLSFAMVVAVHSFRVVLSRYRDDELKEGAFARRYVERWREAFFSMPDVTVKFS